MGAVSTSPVQKVVGYFEVDDVKVLTAESLWRKYRHTAEWRFL